MTWNHEGDYFEGDEEEVQDRAADLGADGTEIQSGLDRYNVLCLVDAYAGAKLHLLTRIAMAGPAICKLSARRLARDCKLAPRTVEKYRASFVDDGVLTRETDDKDRTVFRVNWTRIIELACDGLTRRPVKERVAIIDGGSTSRGTFRRIVDHNGLPINRDWLEHWADPNTPQAPDTMPGRFRRIRKKQKHTPPATYPDPRHVAGDPRQGIHDSGLTPGTLPGPSEPEGFNPNLEPETHNGSLNAASLRSACSSEQWTITGGDGLAPIQPSYAGKPTLIAQALHLMRSEPARTWQRRELIDALGIRYPGEAQRVLKDLRERGYVVKVRHGFYQLTQAGKQAA